MAESRTSLFPLTSNLNLENVTDTEHVVSNKLVVKWYFESVDSRDPHLAVGKILKFTVMADGSIGFLLQ